MPNENPPKAPVERHILIVDPHPLVRRGLTTLIESEPGLSVCAEAANERAALAAIIAAAPEVLILEPLLANGDGLEMVKTIRLRHRHLPILLLSTLNAPSYVERAFRAGASGYVSKQEIGETVLDAIHLLLDGQTYVSPGIGTRRGPG